MIKSTFINERVQKISDNTVKHKPIKALNYKLYPPNFKLNIKYKIQGEK